MLAWCILIFGVASMTFIDTFVNFGLPFRITASVITIFLSSVLLVRTLIFRKLKRVEKLIERNAELEKRLKELNNSNAQKNRIPAGT